MEKPYGSRSTLFMYKIIYPTALFLLILIMNRICFMFIKKPHILNFTINVDMCICKIISTKPNQQW